MTAFLSTMRTAKLLLLADLLLCTPARAQITSAPEFKSDPVFQKGRSAATVDGTSHASAEKSQVNTDLLSHLNRLSGHEGGIRLIQANLLPAAEAWFRERKLPIGVAMALFFSGQESESVRQLISIGRSMPNSVTVVPFLAEAAVLVPPLTASALDVIEKISGRNPASSEAYYYRARLLHHMPEAENDALRVKALDLLKKSIALDPAATAPLLELSRIYTSTGDRPAAIEALEKVLANDPNHLIAHYRIASLYRVTGQQEKARIHMIEFQKLQPKGN